jgi:predicted RecA/RadA family phage recombinase
MKNWVQDGDTINVVSPYALASGAGCLVGSLFGVAIDAVAITTAVNIRTRGVFDLPKTTAEAWTVGQKIYWNDTTKATTTTASTNKLIGVAAQAQLAGDTTGRALLTGAFSL